MAVNWRKARHRAPPGGKFLLVGPDWNGQKPEGFGDRRKISGAAKQRHRH